MHRRLLSLFVLSLPLPAFAQDGIAVDLQPEIPAKYDVKLPKNADLPAVDLRKVDLSELVTPDWQRKRDEVLIPAGPQETSIALKEIRSSWYDRCKAGLDYACIQAQGYATAISRLEAAAAASKPCDQAARDFRKGYDSGKPSVDIAVEYDIACLASLSPRKTKSSAIVPAAWPAVLAGAATDTNLLGAIGLIEKDGKVLCAGLIRPDQTLITARHCLSGGSVASLSVRSALGQVVGTNVKVLQAPPTAETGVPADWAVLKLSPGSTSVAKTNIVKLRSPAEVTLFAAYPYFEQIEYASADAFPRTALRFPRDGMCQAVLGYKGCLQLACQTVRGFSGAPLFSARNVDGSYDVVGFVSGSEGEDTQCEATADIPNSTYAVVPPAISK